MRLYLQMPAAPGKPPRYCHLMLEQELLEGWSLLIESGTQGSAGRVKRAHFTTREAAERALLAARDAQVKRGFRVMFTQGT
jgi:predicted DNA-binding WGR domain protein